MTKKLKTCPFCGGKPKLYKSGSWGSYHTSITETHMTLSNFKFGDSWFVECQACHVSKCGHSEDEVVGEWNKRWNG